MQQEPTLRIDYRKRSLARWIIIGVVLATVVGGFVYFFVTRNADSVVVYEAKSVMTPTPIALQEKDVVYTDAGFSPKTLTIKKGTTVSFKNESSHKMHVASDPHPKHDAYPTKGGCVGSTFDICTAISPSQSWSFTFDAIGTWSYHNDVNPSEDGTIIVQ